MVRANFDRGFVLNSNKYVPIKNSGSCHRPTLVLLIDAVVWHVNSSIYKMTSSKHRQNKVGLLSAYIYKFITCGHYYYNCEKKTKIV